MHVPDRRSGANQQTLHSGATAVASRKRGHTGLGLVLPQTCVLVCQSLENVTGSAGQNRHFLNARLNEMQHNRLAEPDGSGHLCALRGYRTTVQGKPPCRMSDSDVTTELLAAAGGVALVGLVVVLRRCGISPETILQRWSLRGLGPHSSGNRSSPGTTGSGAPSVAPTASPSPSQAEEV